MTKITKRWFWSYLLFRTLTLSFQEYPHEEQVQVMIESNDVMKNDSIIQHIYFGTKNSWLRREQNKHLKWENMTNPLGADRSRWMQSLSDHNLLSNEIKLRDFVLPGSHNSAAFHMDQKACTESLFRIPTGAQKYPFLVQSIPKKTSQNQNIPIIEQLRQGIRFLDLRIIANTNFEGKSYPLHHTFLINDDINSLYPALIAISEFLTVNNMEIVVIRLHVEDGCQEETSDYRSDWEAFIQTFNGTFATLSSNHLDTPMQDLAGKGFIDFRFWSDSITFENWPGSGFGIEKVNDQYCGNPFAYGPYYETIQSESSRFNIYDFFVNPDTESLIWSVLRPLHNGLQQWDDPYNDHLWIMHSIISQIGSNVNALMTDGVDTKPIYEVATLLSLYRVYQKLISDDNNLDAVSSNNFVNQWNKRFEHQCPRGWILSHLKSKYDSSKGDERWEMGCRIVNWVMTDTLSSNSNNTFVKNMFHPSVWGGESNLSNDWKGEINWAFEEGTYALKGLGGVSDDTHKDRRYWFYISQVSQDHLGNVSCKWEDSLSDENSDEFDRSLELSSREWISGIKSIYDDNAKKRNWKFYVCDN